MYYNSFFVAPNSNAYTANQFRKKMLSIVLSLIIKKRNYTKFFIALLPAALVSFRHWPGRVEIRHNMLHILSEL